MLLSKVQNVVKLVKKEGVLYTFKLTYFVLKSRLKKPFFTNLFMGKSGLEVGGPSSIFDKKGEIPIYQHLKNLDGCNFSNKTIWEGKIESGLNYEYFEDKKGFQYISEATDLSSISDSSYDFVISSNCLEHIANPLKAIQEWLRVVRNDGLLLLILPNKDFCFDHNRPITTFAHLIKDFQQDVQEDDLTHLDEILNLHDLDLDKPAGNPERFKERSLKNYENRALHHHVFDVNLLEEIFHYFNLKIVYATSDNQHKILGQKIHD